jgi:zinc protease
VLSSILSDGKTSRLYLPLVYEQKVAKEVSAFQYSRALGSLYVVVVTGAPGVTVEALATATDKALADALATPPSQDELDRVLNGWKKSFYGQVESVLSRAQMLSNYAHLAGNPDYLAQDLARYTTLTPATVHQAAKQWLVPERRVRIDVVPGAQEQEVDE